MIRLVLAILLACPVGLAQKQATTGKKPGEDPVAVARRFLPPNSRLEKLYSFDYSASRVTKRWPAVLTAHIMSPESRDIVFAYRTPRNSQHYEHHLFIAFLHHTEEGYEEIYAVSCQKEVLLTPRAIRILHLKSMDTDAVAVMHGIGAASGGRLDIYAWNEAWGIRNIFPPNGSMDYFYFFPRPEGLTIALTSFLAKRPGLDVSPPPVWYRWNEKHFVKIPSPKGSSKWPLPGD
ncbi:MAG TPA: hypothetical protein VFJ52_07620 [Terriglobia bacterium]|nr:hypothetical protein [Terriglobia bacterium]